MIPAFNLIGRGGAGYDRIDCAIHRTLRLMSLDAEAGGTLELLPRPLN
jgi:hypothetical protein